MLTGTNGQDVQIIDPDGDLDLVLVPTPDALFIPLVTDGAGMLLLSATWPLGPGNYSFWSQYWIVDGGGPAGHTASTAVRTDVP